MTGGAADGDVMECRVCGQAYDPADGDPIGQVQPGTPFCDLPDDWRCPRCDGPKGVYLSAD
jgi:rubredoxin